MGTGAIPFDKLLGFKIKIDKKIKKKLTHSNEIFSGTYGLKNCS